MIHLWPCSHLQDVLDLAELLPQHLLLVEAEGWMVGGHGEQQQELLLRPPVVQCQPIVIDHRVYVSEGPVQDPRSLPVVRAKQSERDQQLAAHHFVRDVGETRQVSGVVGFDLCIPQRVVVLAGQVLQAGTDETELDGDAEVQQAAQELGSLSRGEGGEPAVHALPLDTVPALHHPRASTHTVPELPQSSEIKLYDLQLGVNLTSKEELVRVENVRKCPSLGLFVNFNSRLGFSLRVHALRPRDWNKPIYSRCLCFHTGGDCTAGPLQA